jgi:tellurite methyltransferase
VAPGKTPPSCYAAAGECLLSTGKRQRLNASTVNSSFAIPFCPPSAFPAVWQRIQTSLRPGGRFSGQLFGDRDGWSGEQDITFQTRPQVETLLASFDVEQLEEIEEDGTTASGRQKHWHLFHVIARKRPSG